jgi:archaellum component FlaC
MKKYIEQINSNVENKTYMYRRGVNMLVDNQNIDTFIQEGWVIGFIKPYIKRLTD